jgi:hypothetical protein
MTNSAVRGASRATSVFDHAHRSAKRRNDQLVRLLVSTDICPQVLLRVLGLVAQHGAIPWSTSFERRRRSLFIEIEFDAASPERAEMLLHKVRAIPTVRSARTIVIGANER